MVQTYDVIIVGSGIAGRFVANRLLHAGYRPVMIEKDDLGGVQTLASQGMIHGGQKYALTGEAGAHTASIAAMPRRWEDCFHGKGEIDLRNVATLSDHQLMFPAGGILSRFSAVAAAWAVRGRTRWLWQCPSAVPRGPAFRMEERVVETKSLTEALAWTMRGRIFRGYVEELLPDGQIAVSGIPMRAGMIVFTSGAGNETALELLKVKERHTQRRPLRQIMVKPMDEPLYGHAIEGKPKPRVTVTSHPLGNGKYVWYLGGNVAEEGAKMPEDAALAFAQKEMQKIFPQINWKMKEWASWQGDRAEPYDAAGHLPPGPHVQQRGQVLLAWPTKLTFAPALADMVLERLQQAGVKPVIDASLPALLPPSMGIYPWEDAEWRRV